MKRAAEQRIIEKNFHGVQALGDVRAVRERAEQP